MKDFIKQEYTEFKAADFALDKLFIQWVKGNDPEAEKFWAEWRENNPEKEDEIDLARGIVLALQVKEEEMSIRQINAEWKRTHDAPVNFSDYPADPAKHVSMRALKWYAGIAAGLLLLTTSIFIFRWTSLQSALAEKKPLTLVKETPKGQKLSIVLPDGTEIKLNSDSRIWYPSRFSGDFREVSLEGEAFFDVVHNEKMPFKVHVGNVTVEVLGTSFNVNAYPENAEVEIALVKGAVKVNTGNRTNRNKELFLKPNEMVEINKRDESHQVHSFDPIEVVGWKDGYLYFETAGLRETIAKLERWYGVKFEIAPNVKIDPDWRFNGRFQNRSLDYILRTFSYPDLFKYKIEEQKVMIY